MKGIKDKIVELLSMDLATLRDMACKVRIDALGRDVYLRGLVEISNYCRNNCLYCGIRALNRGIRRYRLSEELIIKAAERCSDLGYGTIVLQSGEDRGIEARWLARIIEKICKDYNLTVTLSLGRRSVDDIKLWKDSGAERYFVRFETSNRGLFSRLHRRSETKTSLDERIAFIDELRSLGYEVGSGFMVGLPGWRLEDLVSDIALTYSLDLDMIGIGPYIPHPNTPLGRLAVRSAYRDPLKDGKISNRDLIEIMLKAIAVLRILMPYTNIPATTAFIRMGGENSIAAGLCAGANVIMPNLTPAPFKSCYDIYPGKVQMPYEDIYKTHLALEKEIISAGFTIGRGPGTSLHFRIRSKAYSISPRLEKEFWF